MTHLDEPYAPSQPPVASVLRRHRGSAAPPVLTRREADVLSLLTAGERVDRIAESLGISARTVEFHLSNARRKLGARTREQAVAIALLGGMIPSRTTM